MAIKHPNIISLIRKCVSLSFLVGIALSFNLWHSDRLFPLIPVIDSLILLPSFVNYIILILLVTSLASIFLFTEKKIILGLFIILFFLLLQDQTRLQPWVYIYVLILIPYSVSDTTKNSLKTINYLQLIFIGIYIWGGIHKLNPNFIEVTFRSMLLFLFKINNTSIPDSFLLLGYSIPLIEIGIGCSLIFRKTRKLGVRLAILTHLVIILYIFSTGIISNSVVLPWNIGMLFCVYFLFYKSKNRLFIFKEPLMTFKVLNGFAICIVFLLPALNFIGKWDTYTSFSFYSAKIKNYYVLVKDQSNYDLTTKIPEKFYRKIEGVSGGTIIDLNLWTYKELNVPFYPEKRVFDRVKTQFCNETLQNNEFVFIEFDKPLWEIYLNKPTTNSVSQLEFLKFDKPQNLPKYTFSTCPN